jgi:hypothetical protein
LGVAVVAWFLANPMTTHGNDSLRTRRHADSPPAAHTGGFGEPTCQVCHAEFEINEPTGTLGVEGLPARYHPRATYEVTVTLHGEDIGRGGFQGAFRFADGPRRGRQAGRVESQDRNVGVQHHAGIGYAQHTRDGSRVVDGGIMSWRFRWIAPADSDAVILHVAANNGNGDDSPFGDFIYTTEALIIGAEHGSRNPHPR